MKKTEDQMKIIDEAEEAACNIEEEETSFKALIFASIISAENDEFTEDVKQDIMRRFGEKTLTANMSLPYEDWLYILQPIGDGSEKLATLLSTKIV